MIYKEHSDLKDKHAFLSASKYHWLNYSDEKIDAAYIRHKAITKGTELHEFAANAIKLGIKLKDIKKTLNMYVNDAIGFKMTPEQVLYYSDNCFGTADAISFRGKTLRIHDLKTGYIPASMNQLKIYVALFCLEYKVDIKDIDVELRIYQDNKIIVHKPEKDEIKMITDKIIKFDKRIEKIKLLGE